MPDYRLLLESNGLDILSNLSDFWFWMEHGLGPSLSNTYPASSLRPHLDKILVSGESAGGYLAAQSMLLHLDINIVAAILIYPMVHLCDRFWDKCSEKPMFGAPHVRRVSHTHHEQS